MSQDGFGRPPQDSVRGTDSCGGFDFLSQRFSSPHCGDARPFWDRQAEQLSGGNHGSIGGSWPMAFSGYPRGP